jgi:hypothetical protein
VADAAQTPLAAAARRLASDGKIVEPGAAIQGSVGPTRPGEPAVVLDVRHAAALKGGGRNEIVRPRLSVCVVAAVLGVACSTRGPVPPDREQVRRGPLTVPQMMTMVEQGTPPSVIIGAIQETGTVYRLTMEQAKAMRASGVPASLLSFIQLTYTHAVEQNPALADSDARWTVVEGYWYGGTPYGWPREWVVGAPGVGEPLRRR